MCINLITVLVDYQLVILLTGAIAYIRKLMRLLRYQPSEVVDEFTPGSLHY